MKTLFILTIFGLLWLKQGFSQTQELIVNGSFTSTGSGSWGYGFNAQRRIDMPSIQYSFSAPACGEISSLIDSETKGIIAQYFVFPKYTRTATIRFKYELDNGINGFANDRFLVLIWDQYVTANDVILLNYLHEFLPYTSYEHTLSPSEIARINGMGMPKFQVQGTGLSFFYTTNYRIDDVSLLAEIGAPVAEFGADLKHVYRGGANFYYDSSSASPSSWLWKFYDGSPGQGYQTSTVQNPEGIFYNYNGKFDVSLTATNPNGSETKVKTNYITVTSPAGISEANSSLLWLRSYPNPVMDVLNMEFKEDLVKQDIELKIFNQIGEIVISEKIPAGTTSKQYDFSKLSSGVYMVQIYTESGRNVVQKVIK